MAPRDDSRPQLGTGGLPGEIVDDATELPVSTMPRGMESSLEIAQASLRRLGTLFFQSEADARCRESHAATASLSRRQMVKLCLQRSHSSQTFVTAARLRTMACQQPCKSAGKALAEVVGSLHS